MRCKHGAPIGYHDCEYVDTRLAFVNEAERYANEKAGPRPSKKNARGGKAASNPAYESWTKVWNLLFHGYIERRVRERYGG